MLTKYTKCGSILYRIDQHKQYYVKQYQKDEEESTMETLTDQHYSTAENHIVNIFSPGATFLYNGTMFTSVISDKPAVIRGGGEGKTDIYVKAVDVDGNFEEIKISYKKENADSYENWVSAARAEATFGENWKQIISDSIKSNLEAFESAPKYARKKQKEKRGGSYVVGYAFDIRNSARNLSTPLDNLTDIQEIEIYSGATLPDVKRDSLVGGVVIENSGVATHMLVSNNINTAQDAIDSLVTIEDYVKDHKGQLHLAYKAINYRFTEDKADAARPLAVVVNWEMNEHGRMVHTVDYDNLLVSNSTEALIKIRKVLFPNSQ